MEFLELVPYEYPKTPQAEVGKFFVRDGSYYHQREHDVLFVNTKNGGLVCSHEVGFLEDCNYEECTREEFGLALNTTILNMDILSGKFKTEDETNR